MATIAIGYPPDILQINFGHLLLPDEQILSLRKEIFAFKIFKEATKTMSVKLNDSNILKAKEAFELMLQRVEAIANK
jgi:hypothetical protein